jgi:hypothetical protein
MLAQLSQWLLIAAIGQAPPEAALAKAAPADVDVAVRVRGIEATRDDLLAMLKAMNPDWATAAEGSLSGPLAEMRQRHGEHAVKSPFLALMKFGDEGAAGGPPPFAIVVHSDNYKGALKELAGGKDVELKHQEGDYDEFAAPDGNGSWYAANAPGVVAFGPSKELIAAIAKRPGQSLDSVLSGTAGRSFFRGDVGLYINAASLTKRFGDQIDQARQMFMAGIDQAAQQGGNAATMEMAKDIYGKMFDSLKFADYLTLSLDAAAQGLHLAGFLKVKSDSDSAKSITDVRATSLASIDKLPPGAMVYGSLNVSAKTFERMQGMSLRMISASGKAAPALQKAVAEFHDLGRIEHVTSMSMDKGMKGLSEMRVDDPKRYIAAAIDMLRAMGEGEGKAGLYKDLKVEENAETYRGLTFTHFGAIMDVQKLAELSGNQPGQVDTMKAMFGDGRLSYWYGTDGKRVLHVIAPQWEEAKSLIDTYLTGQGGVGESAGFKAVRSELPEQANFLMIFNTQSMVRMMANVIANTVKKPDLKVPEDLPKEPAYLGLSLTPHAGQGYELHLAIPGAVGPVIAKGLVPVMQGAGAAGANP